LPNYVLKVEIFFFQSIFGRLLLFLGIFFPFSCTTTGVSSTAVAVSSSAIFKIISSISLSVFSKSVASAAAASEVEASGGAALPAAVFGAKAGGGVSSIASMTVIILHFFGSAGFSAAEGFSFFCKSFISSGPSGLSLLGRDSVITFKISSASVTEGVRELLLLNQLSASKLDPFFSSTQPLSAQD
jgi:hypothetical protein